MSAPLAPPPPPGPPPPGPPPGPRLPAAVQTMLYWVSPRRTLRRWRARHGDVLGATIHPMGRVVFLCGADDIKDLMRADAETFRVRVSTTTTTTTAPTAPG